MPNITYREIAKHLQEHCKAASIAQATQMSTNWSGVKIQILSVPTFLLYQRPIDGVEEGEWVICTLEEHQTNDPQVDTFQSVFEAMAEITNIYDIKWPIRV